MEFNLKVYPSGFLGASDVATTDPIDIATIKHRLFDNSALGNVSAHTANREVSSLWDDAVYGDPAYRSFDFRERILRAALDSFGTSTFKQWVLAQESSPYVTEYHYRWIRETVLYVCEGKAREHQYSTWSMLFTIGVYDTTPIEGQDVAKYLGKGSPTENLSIAEFITAWCAQPAGVDDLLQSLNALFGKR